MEYGPAPEEPKGVAVGADHHHRKLVHFIDGRVATPAQEHSLRRADPSAGTLLAESGAGSARTLMRRLSGAKGVPGWHSADAPARARFFCMDWRAVQKHSRRLAVLTLDNGSYSRGRDIDIHWSHGIFTITLEGGGAGREFAGAEFPG